MYQTALTTCTTLSRSDGPGLHHPVGDAAREVLLEEGQALADDVPVALPADHGGDVGVDALLGDQVLQQQRHRPADQHERRHAEQHGPGLVPEPVGRVGREQRHQRPIIVGMAASTSATSSPAKNSAANSPRAWPTKCR
jgi:hypothetical protein